MKKSNVTLIFDGVGDGLPLMDVQDYQINSYLVYRPDTQEFLHSQRFEDGFSLHVYTKEPFFSHFFETEKQAFQSSVFIEYETIVVPLFDLGDKLAVGFPCDTEV